MDDSDRGFSSSSPIRPSTVPKSPMSDAGGVDENDLNCNKMGSKLQNPKKAVPKHFMSPTISAASKAAVPRKKILAERNEALTSPDAHHLNVPIPDPKASPLNHDNGQSSRSSSRLSPLCSSAPESDDDAQNPFVANSSWKPYDPLTNYLSPRPKFLRYKPNRRRDIFLGEGKKDESGLRRSASSDYQNSIVEEDLVADDCVSPPTSSRSGYVKQDDEGANTGEEDESDEEIEELEEGGGQTLKGFFKFLLVLVVLCLSTLYISSMNSPNPSPTLQAINDLKGGYYKIQNRIFEAITGGVVEGESESFDPKEEIQLDLLSPSQRTIEYGIEEAEMVEEDDRKSLESTEVLDKMVELQNDHSEDLSDGEVDKTQKVSEDLMSSEFDETDNDQLKETKFAESPGMYENELKDKVEGSDDLQEMEGTDRTNVGDHELERNGEEHEHVEDERTPIIASYLSASEKEWNEDSYSQVLQTEANEIFDEASEMERDEDITREASDELHMPERLDSEKSDSTKTETWVNSLEEGLDEQTKQVPRELIGVSIFLTIAAFSGLGFYLRRKRTSTQSSSLPLGESIAPEIAENISPLPSDVEEDQNPKVEPLVNQPSLARSTDKPSSKELNQSQTPRVELLAEFVVGEQSSTIKSCGTERQKMMEIAESNASVSMEERSGKPLMVSSQAHPSVSEFSAIDSHSPSYGSFTAEKKIKKKEEGRDGELRTAVTTPVRRSSRIRNRSIMSP